MSVCVCVLMRAYSYLKQLHKETFLIAGYRKYRTHVDNCGKMTMVKRAFTKPIGGMKAWHQKYLLSKREVKKLNER